MNIIVSTGLEDNFREFKVLKRFSALNEYVNELDVVVLNSFEDSDFDVGIIISKLHKEGNCKFVYINENPNPLISMAITGVGGDVLKDDFYLSDEDELLGYLENAGVLKDKSPVTLTVSVVKDFVHAFCRGEERIKTPAYLSQVNQAVNDLVVLTQQQEIVISDMSTSAIEIFEKASKIIKTMAERKKDIEQKLEELTAKDSGSSSSTGGNVFNNSAIFFPPHKYMGTKPILLIRELSPCKYLSSFVLGYHQHLKYVKNRRVKLIFVHQKGQGVSLKYNNFFNITQESASVDSLYEGDIIATNNPKKDVMTKLLGNTNTDIFIVVDRLYSTNDIVTGKVTKLNAISGDSDIDRYKVKDEDCIGSIASNLNLFYCVPYVVDYPGETDARYATYLQLCDKIYNQIDATLHI